MLTDVLTCDYCYRHARITVHLRQTWFRKLLRLPPRTRRVCTDHIRRDARPRRG